MPYLEIYKVFADQVCVRVHVEGYTYFRVFCRPRDTNDATEFKGQRASDFYVWFEDLMPGVTYVLNLMYGYTADDCTNYAYSSNNLPTFTTKISVSMGIAPGAGIATIVLKYTMPNGDGAILSTSSTEVISVLSDTTHYVEDISLLPGYKHPVYCEGQTTWQMTDANGNFLDNELQMGSTYKAFRFYATESENPGTGKVWINGQYYQPYIFSDGSWKKASAHVRVGKWIKTKGG